jgi:hypothetical protein
MRSSRILFIAALPFALAACPGDRTIDDPTTDPMTDPAVEQPATAPAMAERADLQDLGGLGITGEVMATPREGRTDIALNIQAGPPNESLGARVQSGTCESPGPVLANLDAVRTNDMGQGRSETNVGHAPHLIMDGNHIVAVYAPGTEPERDQPAACTPLPQHGGQGMMRTP